VHWSGTFYTVLIIGAGAKHERVEPSKGEIAEIIVADIVFDEKNRRAVELFLSRKCGIALAN
jgi:hypothetical protein